MLIYKIKSNAVQTCLVVLSISLVLANDSSVAAEVASSRTTPSVSPIPSPNESYIKERPSTCAADLLFIRQNSTPGTVACPSTEFAVQQQQNGPDFKFLRSGQGKKPFTFGVGSVLEDPTALQGPTRQKVLSLPRLESDFSIYPYLRQRLGTNQSVILQAGIDPQQAGFDLSYTNAPKSLPGAFSVNIFNESSLVPVFEEGRRKVYLPHRNNPWLHRLGGGIEYFQSLAPKLNAALALNYQRISVRNGMFSSHIARVDQFGDRLTFSNRGQDDLLTLNFAALYLKVDDINYPTRGSKVRFGMDQSIPVGAANILLTRFNANISQFIPFNIFGFRKGPRTLVLNLQGGTIIGDAPPYEAFSLGGSSSVRGYDDGAVGSGRSFIQTTGEYRFPAFALIVRKQHVNVRGILFVDYATTFGTGNEVLGKPSVVRDKPGEGLGYGIGLQALTPFGLLRLESGWNERGGNRVYVDVGDRF